jgi:tetratricopeptide (TPR) repeat protein
MSRRVVVALVAGLVLPAVAAACLWDYDTIKMERSRFPDTLELITGKFLRHSPEFYQWRITDRLKRLEADPANVQLLDDLAVAYDKTGQHDKAIETAKRTEAIQPGRYETAANLGTFYFHAGKLTDGMPHIDRALAINPDAHFGREVYQKKLVEYVLARRKVRWAKLPLATVIVDSQQQNREPSVDDFIRVEGTFGDFLKPRPSSVLMPDQAAAAVKGVLGMMKFGKHDSPVLLEALGSLLSPGELDPHNDAKYLATRAYLKASYEVPDGPARVAYRRMAASTIRMQTPRSNMSQVTLEQVEADFQKELAEGAAWYADLRDKELSWIRDGKNPEAEFDKLYEAEPAVSGMDVPDPMTVDEKLRRGLMICGGVVAVMFIGVVVGVVRLLRRKPPTDPSVRGLSGTIKAHGPERPWAFGDNKSPRTLWSVGAFRAYNSSSEPPTHRHRHRRQLRRRSPRPPGTGRRRGRRRPADDRRHLRPAAAHRPRSLRGQAAADHPRGSSRVAPRRRGGCRRCPPGGCGTTGAQPGGVLRGRTARAPPAGGDRRGVQLPVRPRPGRGQRHARRSVP